jgi:uncharacterized protein involved in outer membrane biogenesis
LWSLQLVLFGVLAAVILVLGWLQSQDFEVRAVQLVERVIESRTGEQCTITDVRVMFWPLGVAAEGVHLFHSESGDTIASVERIRAPLTLRAGRPSLGRLRLDRPTVELALDAEGRPLAFRNAPRPETPRPLARLPFAELEINAGRIRVTHPEGEAALRRLTLTPEDDGTHTLQTRLAVSGRGLNDLAKVRWTGIILGPEAITVPALSLDFDALQVSGALTVDIDGPLDLDASVKADLQKLQPLLAPP